MKKIFPYIALFIFTIVFVILLNINIVSAADHQPRGPHPKIMEQLTEEQKTEVKAKMKELWDSGASREEMRETIHQMFEEYGVEMPKRGQGDRGKRKPGHGRGFMKFADQLSEEQQNTIKDKVKELRQEGASREDIHEEVTALFKEYGVEIPEDVKNFRGKRGRRSGRGFMTFTEDFQKHRQMMENLDEEQRKIIRAKVREMRKNGATREEIKMEVDKIFQDWGISESDNSSNQSAQSSGELLTIRNYPNPFNPQTNIEYSVKSSSQVSITIYDVQGKQVKSLADEYKHTGTYTTKWNGRNESGSQVPSGVYFIRISTGNETLNHRIVMMK